MAQQIAFGLPFFATVDESGTSQIPAVGTTINEGQTSPTPTVTLRTRVIGGGLFALLLCILPVF